jgi:putative nucleotidyltransferase with HDIG domain
MLQEGGLMKIPTRSECLAIMKGNNVPQNIVEHCKAVTAIALELGTKINANGGKVNLRLLEAAALLHDVSKYECITSKAKESDHGKVGANRLKKAGMGEIAEIVEAHMLDSIFDNRLDSWEKKLLYYADKRVNDDKRVSLDERFAYLYKRYPTVTKKFRKAEPLVRALENEIIEKTGGDVLL